MKSYHFRKAGLLVAGPTAGKTTFLRQLRNKGVTNILETEEVQERIIPEYNALGFSRKNHSPDGRFIKKMRDLVIASMCEREQTPDTLILTNLWGDDFIKALFPGNGKPMLYVGRASTERVVELTKQRGVPLSEGLVGKWTAAAENYVPRKFDVVVWLPDNVYLADVVTFAKGEWVLTPLGKSLSRMTSSEVKKLGTLSEVQLKELGGANVL